MLFYERDDLIRSHNTKIRAADVRGGGECRRKTVVGGRCVTWAEAGVNLAGAIHAIGGGGGGADKHGQSLHFIDVTTLNPIQGEIIGSILFGKIEQHLFVYILHTQGTK